VCSSPLNIYHGTDNIIKQSFISYSSMKLRRWVWVPLFALSFKKVWIRPQSGYFEKNYRSKYIWVNIVLEKNIGLRPKLGNTYYHITRQGQGKSQYDSSGSWYEL
jgi:hypothetical protein